MPERHSGGPARRVIVRRDRSNDWPERLLRTIGPRPGLDTARSVGGGGIQALLRRRSAGSAQRLGFQAGRRWFVPLSRRERGERLTERLPAAGVAGGGGAAPRATREREHERACEQRERSGGRGVRGYNAARCAQSAAVEVNEAIMTQSPVVKKQTRPPVHRNKCTAFGLDNICSDIISGRTLTAIAADIGVAVGTLIEWAEEDSNRSARVRAARELAARAWDEMAELGIAAATDPFELSKAKELAHHYRWRAKAVAPRDYGDRVLQEHTGAGGGPIGIAAIDVKGLTDAELAQMQALLTRAAPLPGP